jgi:hypothetical protein
VTDVSGMAEAAAAGRGVGCAPSGVEWGKNAHPQPRLQFPLYGVTIGYGLSQRRMIFVAAVVLVHVVATIGCFSGLIPNF